jgi:peptide-methionine (S)-S-oxide reductase
MEKIGLGGGCHWCTEGIFQMLRGVAQVDQGFIRSDPPSDTWAEGVIVHFDPAAIDLAVLIEVHLRTHSATKAFIADGKYRSAIYFHDAVQEKRAIDTIGSLQCEFENPIQTRALRFREFKPSDERYRNYYATDPERPFCQRYIDPKLNLIRRNFADIMSPHDGRK